MPEGLTAAAASGVPTLAELRDSFPDAAHEAIRASIMASAGDGVVARSRAFLKAQVASRSLTPQPGMAPTRSCRAWRTGCAATTSRARWPRRRSFRPRRRPRWRTGSPARGCALGAEQGWPRSTPRFRPTN